MCNMMKCDVTFEQYCTIHTMQMSSKLNFPQFYQYHKWLGVVGSHRNGGVKACEEVRLPNALRWSSLALQLSQKVAKSMDNNNSLAIYSLVLA